MGYKQIFNPLSGTFDTVLDTESPQFTGTVIIAQTTPGVEQLTSSSTALAFSLEQTDIAFGTTLKAEIQSGQMSLTYDDGITIVPVTPSLPEHVTTKAYVDASVAAVGGGSSTYVIDEFINKTSADTSATGLVYKRIKDAKTLTSFSGLITDKSGLLSGEILSVDVKVGELPYTLTSRFNLSSTVYAIAIQGDGKVLVGGNFTSYNGVSANRIIRLTANGAIDTAFLNNVGGGFSGGTTEVRSIKLLSDGSIIVGGTFTSYSGNSVTNLCKLTSTGTFVSAFSSGRGFGSGSVFDVQVRPSDKIIVGGSFTTTGYAVAAKGLIQLNSDGSYDNTFAAANLSSTYKINKMLLMADGSLFAAGQFTGYATLAPVNSYPTYNGIIKLTTAGISDATFSTTGLAGGSPVANDIALHLGNIILVGDFSNASFGGAITSAKIGKLDSTTGAVTGDSNTMFGTGAGSVIYSVTVMPDDSILLSGPASFNGTTGLSVKLFRVSTTGVVTTAFSSFNSGGIVYIVKFVSGGKLLVGGSFSTVASIPFQSIVRLSSAGILDTTYDTLVSIFTTPPIYTFSTSPIMTFPTSTITNPTISAGSYLRVDVPAAPSTFLGSFYINLY